MRFTSDRSDGDPEKAARKLIEIANSVETAQEDRIFIELINWPFLSEHKGSPAEYKTGLELVIARGWLVLHESGTYVKFTPAGAESFAKSPGKAARRTTFFRTAGVGPCPNRWVEPAWPNQK
jgi:hypothetical protein